MKGLYEIYSGDRVIYVGESSDLLKRWKQHSLAIWDAEKLTTKAVEAGMAHDGLKDHDLYFHLAWLKSTGVVPAVRCLMVLEDKKTRLAQEHERVFVCRSLGHEVFNKAESGSYRLSSATREELQAEFDKLIDPTALTIELTGGAACNKMSDLQFDKAHSIGVSVEMVKCYKKIMQEHKNNIRAANVLITTGEVEVSIVESYIKSEQARVDAMQQFIDKELAK